MAEQPRLASLDKALAILDCFSRQRPLLRVSEIASMLNIDKSYASRCLARLAAHGFVAREESGEYALGFHLFTLGSMVPSHLRLSEPAHPIIAALSQRAGRTVQIGVRQGASYVPIATADIPSMRYPVALGSSIPIHVSAAGKAILAFSDPDSHYWGMPIGPHGELTKLTKYTIGTIDELLAELCEIREMGYSVARQEMDEYQYSIAAPVFDYTRSVVCAVVVFCVLGIDEDGERVPDMVREAAAELSHRLGMPGDDTPARTTQPKASRLS